LAYNRSQVAKLLTAAETELFELSLADRIRTLSAVQLRAKRQRARTLRDKADDLLRRQKLASRARTGSKLGQSGAANERTQKKAQILAETLQRFDKRLEQIDGEQAPRAGAKTSPRPARVGKTAKAAAKTSEKTISRAARR